VKSDYQYTLDFAVRDYECDMQGIVNNSVYQNYLEHARHEFLKSREVDFAELTQQGIHLVVVRAELDYKQSLASGDQFFVGINFEIQGKIRFVFHQDIIRADGKLAVRAKVTGTSLNPKGRPFVAPDLQKLL